MMDKQILKIALACLRLIEEMIANTRDGRD
ncbi:hypothetical protein SDC9_87602 [bioreactor metagenome]|uniref:Uncharacterized protein n=1 Tax=bioreactor metagenome TaxID=1076179 RepID=A0A644ZQP3_9ZZZZ